MRDDPEQRLAEAPTEDFSSPQGGPRKESAPVLEPETALGWATALIGRSVGSYRIVRPLGRGGMGVVFEAVHEGIGQRAAVKVLSPALSADPQLVQRFWSEARAVSRAAHPGLVKIFDFGQLADGTLYLLMEFLEGEELRARLDRSGGRLPLGEALRLGRQVAAALAAAHARGIAHRDLKPDNLFIVRDDEAAGGERTKVLDFGLARVLDARPDAPAHTTGSRLVMGTPAYMAPEQCRGLGQAEGQADVYALGVVLFEALAGRTPFQAESPGELLALHLSAPPPPLRELAPSVPAEVAAMIDGMLRKDPGARPTMEAVAAALGQLGGHSGTAWQEPAVAASPARWRGPAVLAALLLLLVVGAAGLLLRDRGAAALRPAAAAVEPVAPPATPPPAAPTATPPPSADRPEQRRAAAPPRAAPALRRTPRVPPPAPTETKPPIQTEEPDDDFVVPAVR